MADLTQTQQPWKPAANPWLIAAAVMLATFMEVLDTSVANVSLNYIAIKILLLRSSFHPSFAATKPGIQIRYVRRTSSTHDIAAIVLGKPIVVIANTPTCRSSSATKLPLSKPRQDPIVPLA